LKEKEIILLSCGPFEKEFLEKKYKEDKNLNNIPLIFFDRLFYSNWRFKIKYDGTYHGPCSLADNTCMYKHLMIYEIIECTPVFESEEK